MGAIFSLIGGFGATVKTVLLSVGMLGVFIAPLAMNSCIKARSDAKAYKKAWKKSTKDCAEANRKFDGRAAIVKQLRDARKDAATYRRKFKAQWNVEHQKVYEQMEGTIRELEIKSLGDGNV